MAIDLMAEQLVDSHSGQRGLTDKQLTLLHDHSIRDDPTRVIRAARYAARLGFTLDEQTQDQITQTIQAWPWAWSTSASATAAPPALSTRLRMELDRLFQHEPWAQAIACLQQWQALPLIDPSLQGDPRLMRRLHWAQRLGAPPHAGFAVWCQASVARCAATSASWSAAAVVKPDGGFEAMASGGWPTCVVAPVGLVRGPGGAWCEG